MVWSNMPAIRLAWISRRDTRLCTGVTRRKVLQARAPRFPNNTVGHAVSRRSRSANYIDRRDIREAVHCVPRYGTSRAAAGTDRAPPRADPQPDAGASRRGYRQDKRMQPVANPVGSLAPGFEDSHRTIAAALPSRKASFGRFGSR